MTYIEEPSAAADDVRRLAGAGQLKDRFWDASRDEQRRLRAGAAEIAGPLVYERVTRPVERRRHHYECATTLQRMLPDCLDRFHDDVDAVLDDLFAHAKIPIANLEGWITSRLRRATIEGHRRRRGERGAPQRPRVPAWLAEELEHDAWLIDLAKATLEWVGTDATAGSLLWPLNAFADRRAAFTGNHTAGEAVVAGELEVVLAAMRRRPAWYAKYVERPIGRKPAQVWYPPYSAANDSAEPTPLALVDPHERDDAVLREIASVAIEIIGTRINGGEDVTTAVIDVLAAMFGSLADSDDLENEEETSQIAALIDDPVKLKRIVATVLEILGDGGLGDVTS
ncbi:hypothetical protein AB0E69_12780 [Kribbella sp. NPDC026611]|uniref:hypothetical protein n=1 Tax=Kribbella sp. NPDC026611 TaxID=3154911 RepID=UPI0033E9787D